MKCPLCQTSHTDPFKVEKKPAHDYFHCAECDLIFMDPAEHLSPTLEKARYDLHENTESEGYRAFFQPLVDWVTATVPVFSDILDYGCGPTAFLAKWLGEKKYSVDAYDPFFFPKTALRKYDAIVSTEVFEHMAQPGADIEKLLSLLSPGGFLVVMTSGHSGRVAFAEWSYRRDATHVSFFSEKTFLWLAKKWNLQIVKSEDPLWIFANTLSLRERT